MSSAIVWDERRDREASKVECYAREPTPKVTLPRWFDRQQFDRSRTILSQYFFSILFTHLSGLILLVFIKSIYRTLSTSGKSNSLVALFYRYADTLLTIKSWYEEDILDPKSAAHRSLQRVKMMHYNTASWQNKHLERGKDELSISMRDMILTQVNHNNHPGGGTAAKLLNSVFCPLKFAFVGLAVLHPKSMGFSTSDEELGRLVYFWRTIGHLLGMPDEHNLCEGSLEQVRARCRQVFEHNYRPRLMAAVAVAVAANEGGGGGGGNEPGLSMSRAIIYTSQQYIYFLRYTSLMKYLFEVMALKGGDHHFRLRTTMEKFTYLSMRNVMSHWIHFRVVAFLLNNVVRLSVYCLHFRYFRDNIAGNLGGGQQQQQHGKEI